MGTHNFSSVLTCLSTIDSNASEAVLHRSVVCGDDHEASMSIDRIHGGNDVSSSESTSLILVNAQAVYPNIPLADALNHCDGITQCRS